MFTIIYYINVRKKTKISGKRYRWSCRFKENIFEGDTAKCSYELCKMTDIINDTLPCYHIDSLPECYNETLLKKTILMIKEKNNVMKKLNIT